MSEMHGNDMSFGVVPAEQRLSIYLDYLNEAKERQMVKEVLARTILVSLAQMNQHYVKEYPLIPVQQDALIEFITLRSSYENKIEEYIQRIINNFIDVLEKYAYACETDNATDKETYRADVMNAESLLVKCMQGICFSIALCGDNFFEALQHIFGERAISISDNIIHDHPMGEEYWQKHLEKIIVDGVQSAFEDMRETKDVEVKKEKQLLTLTYSFGSIFKRLNPHRHTIEKSQFQQEFEKTVDANSPHNAQAMLELLERTNAIEFDAPLQLREIIGQLMRLDACMGNFRENPKEKLVSPEKHFQELQLLSVACGAFIALTALETNFLRAVGTVFPQALDRTKEELLSFSPSILERIFYHFVEVTFIQILCRCFGESRSQIRLKILHVRVIPKKAVEALAKEESAQGYWNALWQEDAKDSASLQFVPLSPQELKTFLQENVRDPRQVSTIVRLWQNAEIQVKFNILIYIDKLAQTTTNLNHRLSQLLGRFGILSV